MYRYLFILLVAFILLGCFWRKPAIRAKFTIAVMTVLLLILAFPRGFHIKDGGSYGYEAPLYQVTFWHGMGPDGEPDYYTGTTVAFMGWTVYDTGKLQK